MNMPNKAAAGAAAGAAVGSNSGRSMSSDTSYNKDNGMTAQDTARNQNETQLVQQIRSEIATNKNLSTNAHNVKIISQNGQIYLKGPVADANEKEKVAEIAKRVAGNTTVINQTTIEARSSGASSGQSGSSTQPSNSDQSGANTQ
jgi:osmotically-inducible protein OsmY